MQIGTLPSGVAKQAEDAVSCGIENLELGKLSELFPAAMGQGQLRGLITDSRPIELSG